LIWVGFSSGCGSISIFVRNTKRNKKNKSSCLYRKPREKKQSAAQGKQAADAINAYCKLDGLEEVDGIIVYRSQ